MSLFYTSLHLIFSARNFFNSFREDHEMMHLRDLQKLEGVLSPSHLEVNYFPQPSDWIFLNVITVDIKKIGGLNYH